jgi:hypothetical protein
MGMVKGLVENVSTKYDKYSVQVNGTWYNTKMEYAKVKPNKGDLVEFDDGGAKFTKNMKIVTAGAGGVYGSPKPSAGKGSYSSLGVELGHAANLAMQMALAEAKTSSLEIGSTAFYKEFVTHTRKVKAIMQGLRDEFEGATSALPVEPADEEVVVLTTKTTEPDVEKVDVTDLF